MCFAAKGWLQRWAAKLLRALEELSLAVFAFLAPT
jgi:drug/metabolite transporter superfamily protein YnfA